MNKELNETRAFSVIMSTYNQAAFIRRAIASLLRQTFDKWELIIVNDGSTDNTEEFLKSYLSDRRIKYVRNKVNKGLGFALNQGQNAARYNYVAYLPSDDFFDAEHLESLGKKLWSDERLVLAFSGIRFDESVEAGVISLRSCKGSIPGYCLQLAQVGHLKTVDRWIERGECVSEDLFYLFWRKLMCHGTFAPTGEITCEWTNHPLQHHKIYGEKFGGGLNKYRAYYNISTPLRFRSSNYKTIDEVLEFDKYRKSIKITKERLKILIVGELAYNSERIMAFEEAGHSLYGLWAKPRFCYSTVGPLPFGHVEDVSHDRWRERIDEIRPDIIYSQLSTSAIELAHEVLMAKTGIPFIWHFKEGPHEAMKSGLWSKLIDLYNYADGRIYINDEIRQWFGLFMPEPEDDLEMVLDGDLPKAECFEGRFSSKLSESDGAIHTVISGRIIGLTPNDMKLLAASDIHLHVYNENHVSEKYVIEPFRRVAPNHFHVHRHCSQSKWVEEFSQYDAGWLHCVDSFNGGSLLRTTWADLNVPARISTMVAAGLPMIQKRNDGHIFVQRSYVERYGMGLFYDTIDELVRQLRNKRLLENIHYNIMRHRKEFTFDEHIEDLEFFFRKVIRYKRKLNKT